MLENLTNKIAIEMIENKLECESFEEKPDQDQLGETILYRYRVQDEVCSVKLNKNALLESGIVDEHISDNDIDNNLFFESLLMSIANHYDFEPFVSNNSLAPLI